MAQSHGGIHFPQSVAPNPGLPTVRWKIELVGESEERSLAKMFAPRSNPPLQGWAEDGKHYLHAAEFEGMDSSAAVLPRRKIPSIPQAASPCDPAALAGRAMT